jgi:hypothetical protein
LIGKKGNSNKGEFIMPIRTTPLIERIDDLESLATQSDPPLSDFNASGETDRYFHSHESMEEEAIRDESAYSTSGKDIVKLMASKDH